MLMKQRTTIMALLLLGATAMSTVKADSYTDVPVTGKADWYVKYDGAPSTLKFKESVEGCKVIDGWFGDGVTTLANGAGPYTFYGRQGVYVFYKHDNYLEVIPMSDQLDSRTATERNADNFYRYSKAANQNDGKNHLWYDPASFDGAIWVAGGDNFGFPTPNGKNGWNTNTQENPYADNATAMFHPNGSNVYTISIKTGEQMGTGTSMGSTFMFKFYHTPLFEVAVPNQNDVWEKYHEFRHSPKTDNSGSNYKTTIDFYPTVDYLKITDGTNSSNVSDNEGNITPPEIGFDSWLPTMPKGYTFKFTVDPTATISGFNTSVYDAHGNYYHVPLKVELVANDWTSSSYKDGDNKYVLNLNDGNGNKRITLRDALRFDGGLEYDKSYNTGDPSQVQPMDLTISGMLTTGDDSDWAYLIWLGQHNKITHLDLSNATWDGMSIPDYFTYGDALGIKAEGLTEVKVPDLQNIGKKAFIFCKNLTNANEIVSHVHGTIGDAAFQECNNAAFTQLDITENITSLGYNAFENCTSLTKVTVTNAGTTCQENTFQGINANHCELDFTGVSDANITAYRAQAGWLYLATKDIYEDEAYDVVHQSHANVRLHRTFNTVDSQWNTLVLPFDVTTTQVKAKDNNFDNPAYLIDNVVTGSTTMRFLIVNDENTEWADHTNLKAGKPFVIQVVNNKGTDGVYTFVDVETKATPDAIQSYSATVGNGAKFTFQGTYATTDLIQNVYLIRNGSLIWANYAKFKGYRGWFEYADGGAKVQSFPIEIMGLGTTQVLGINRAGEVSTPKNIYNLNGQLVRSHALSTEGLPHGIYVIEGKKVVVK